jgi:hypothetical protein
MSPQTLERVSTDWFDLVIQQLDALREDCGLLDEGSIAPSVTQFETAKTTVENFRRLADFPNLPEPDVWAGVNGEIGITWQFASHALELVITDRVYARIFDSNEQAAVELSQVPVLLQKLTTRSAA